VRAFPVAFIHALTLVRAARGVGAVVGAVGIIGSAVWTSPGHFTPSLSWVVKVEV